MPRIQSSWLAGCPPLVDPVVGAAVVECEEDQRQEEGDHERGQVLVPEDVVGVEVEVADGEVVLGCLKMHLKLSFQLSQHFGPKYQTWLLLNVMVRSENIHDPQRA